MAAEREAALLQGFCSDEGAWHLYRLTRRNLGKLWMNGIGGDVLTGRFVTVEHATDLHNALTGAILRGLLGSCLALDDR